MMRKDRLLQILLIAAAAIGTGLLQAYLCNQFQPASIASYIAGDLVIFFIADWLENQKTEEKRSYLSFMLISVAILLAVFVPVILLLFRR